MTFTTLLIIPTGIGAAIGGYAGDGIPVARLLAQVSDRLITHPNVLNGAMLYWPLANTLYVEGYALDQVCRGTWKLRPVLTQKVGVILDRGLSESQFIHHHNVIQAAQATLGLTIGPVIQTEVPLQIALMTSERGNSWGSIANPDVLFRAGVRLKAQGATAIALVARLPDLGMTDYDQGKGVDPIAGVEALLSHLLVRQLQIPCAHAPALDEVAPMITHPRTSAESLGFTFLPSVLVGLSTAPSYIPQDQALSTDLDASQINAVVVPAQALGGSGVLALMQRPQPPVLIAVAENTTQTQVSAEALSISHYLVNNYWEAAGIISALKAGIDPQRVRR